MDSFLQLAHVLRDEAAAVHSAIARLIEQRQDIVTAVEIERLQRRAADLAKAAAVFDELVVHERVVRTMIAVGTLESLPSRFSPNTADLAPGNKVLLRATVIEALPREGRARVLVEAGDEAVMRTVDRAAIAGVERPAPTMFREKAPAH